MKTCLYINIENWYFIS